jgi:hypothetical protein
MAPTSGGIQKVSIENFFILMCGKKMINNTIKITEIMEIIIIGIILTKQYIKDEEYKNQYNNV